MQSDLKEIDIVLVHCDTIIISIIPYRERFSDFRSLVAVPNVYIMIYGWCCRGNSKHIWGQIHGENRNAYYGEKRRKKNYF
jgi:hypothetical protein